MALGVMLDPAARTSREFLSHLDPRLAVIIQETSTHRTRLRKVHHELLRSGPPTRKPADPQRDSEMASEASSSSPGAPSLPTPPFRPLVPPTLSASQKRKRNQKANKAQRLADKKAEGPGKCARNDILGSKPRVHAKNPGRSPLHGKCPHCSGRPMEQQCVRRMSVQSRNCKDLLGSALTCASVGDRLKPKPLRKRKKGSATVPKRRTRIRYFDPLKDLNMTLVQHRPEVYRRCGQDIVVFVWERPGGKFKTVGGVRFKAFSEEILAQLIDNHRRVEVRAIRRRAEMEAWAYGTMTGGGSRQPAGGRQGDGYGPYACHRGDTPDDIKALFRLATDADILVEAGDSIFPGLKPQLAWTTAEAHVNRLGRYGLSLFNCHNYISSTHEDPDIGQEDLLSGNSPSTCIGGLYPCAQLVKENCGPHDYNFAYARWGMVVQTQPNTVWVFNGRHAHGTVMPSQSAVNQNATSAGIHPTARARSRG
ncbi:hypothetical protein B0H11DRAFT_2253636 [Mycena galericulata]|nr:hypothetical protein B0H11DRAFT_2253636 [Mycena galericulata]